MLTQVLTHNTVTLIFWNSLFSCKLKSFIVSELKFRIFFYSFKNRIKSMIIIFHPLKIFYEKIKRKNIKVSKEQLFWPTEFFKILDIFKIPLNRICILNFIFVRNLFLKIMKTSRWKKSWSVLLLQINEF